MGKIFIDIKTNEDILEKYNSNVISNDLIEYIMKQTIGLKNSEIELVINNKTNTKITDKLKKGFEDYYQNSLKKKYYNNVRQFILFIIGLILLIISMTIEIELLKEILLIGSWVPIWEAFDSELFLDFNEKTKRKILKKLMKSKIIENME